MNDLDNLRPEVREAVGAVDRWMTNDPDWLAIRTELLSLAEDAAMFAHAVSLGQRYKQRAETAESELAALKARIAEAPVYEIPLSKPKSEDGWACVIESVKNERSVRGKRVRLVVEG